MAEELPNNIAAIKQIPRDTHLFCPRNAEHEHTYFYDEDIADTSESEKEKKERHKAIAETKKRHDLTMRTTIIWAYDGDTAREYGDWLKERLSEQLNSCEVCIRMFHRARHELPQQLEEVYETEQVESFLEVFDGITIERIKKGTDIAKKVLENNPPDKRTINDVPQEALFSLFEALSCERFLRNEELLAKHFDVPFKLIQTKRRLRLACYVPAMTRFLFGSHEYRSEWGFWSWIKIKHGPSETDFDWAIRNSLIEALQRVRMDNLEVQFLPTFWSGLRTIIERLDEDRIKHSLRALDIDVYRLALDHFSIEADHVTDLTMSMKLLLEKSPAAFWDAMGAISPSDIIKQILKNKILSRNLTTNTEEDALAEYFSWIEPFLQSIKPTNLGPPCYTIVTQLLGPFQADHYTRTARLFCQQKGLRVLHTVLERMNAASSSPAFLGSATIAHALEMVDRQAQIILGLTQNSALDNVGKIALGVVEQAIKLDCVSLDETKRQILGNKPVDPIANQNTHVWGPVTLAVRPPRYQLPVMALSGAELLIELEPFVEKDPSRLTNDMKSFNGKLDVASQRVSDLLYKLSEFKPDDLDPIFEEEHLASGVLSHLFSSADGPYEGAVELLKIVSLRDSRREALGYFLEKFYRNVLFIFSTCLQKITSRRIFGPTPHLLKVCADTIEYLCNAQDGLLRSKSMTPKENAATEAFWRMLWGSLRMVFEMTESWSVVGRDKHMMMDFCRDTMQLADNLFDHYSLFASKIVETTKMSREDALRQLLRRPTETFLHMARWLRLRDEFLTTRSVSLTTKLLKKLKEVNIDVPEPALVFVSEVVIGKIKSALSPMQKIKLQSALEEYTGKTFRAPAKGELKPEQQLSIGAFFRSEPRFDEKRVTSAASSDNDIDEEASINRMLQGSAAYKAKLEIQKKKQPSIPVRQPSKTADVSDFKKKRQAEMEAQKKKQAAAIAKARKDAESRPERGTGMYVSSEEESEGDDLDHELFGLSKSKKKDKRPGNAKPREAMLDIPRGPVKKQRQVRSAKDMRARLAPDLSQLHRTILGWDYFHNGDFPPNSKPSIYQQVSDTFRTSQDYENAFKPLLLLEAWQGFVKAREESTFKPYEIKVVSRSSVDSFQEFSTTMSQTDNKEIMISEGDVVLISKDSSPATSQQAPHCLARVFRIKRQKSNLEVSYRIVPNNPLASSLNPGAMVFGAKIQSITPLEREYGALTALKYYDLCDEIIKASPSPLLPYTDKQLQPLINTYNVNKAQAKAVQSALDNDAFTLIQGPPGTGKTKTIVAIVGALLSDKLGSQAKPIITPVGHPGGFGQNSIPAPKKLLVCAPSNAAVDELVMRFKEGVKSLSGQQRKINVVRLGRSDAINTNIRDVTLDELVNAKLGVAANGMPGNSREANAQVFKEHQAVSEKLREAREALDRGTAKGDDAKRLKDDFDALRRRKAQLGNKIENVRDSEANQGRQAEVNRRRAQQQVLDEAHIICATLSGSGHEMFQSLNIEFETVVVDEAAQCVEMSAIIPLKYGCAKCILVGDPKQLPPTVFSKEATRFQYERSLFVRMQGNHPDAVHLLDTQYRMHPDISAFPSQSFYDGRLLDGPDMAPLRKQPWHINPILGPYRFFDVQGQHRTAPKGHSLINIAEIDYAMELYQTLSKNYRGGFDLQGKIGIITPYKSQLRELKTRFIGRYGETILDTVEFNTTDAFQGRESEVIIFSCVRASPAGGIGFLQDIRRMNVGLTRAKSSLWVLGNAESLARGEYWKKLVDDARKRNLFTEGSLQAAIRSAAPRAPKEHSLKDSTPRSPIIEQVKTEFRETEPRSRSSSIAASRRSSASSFAPAHANNGKSAKHKTEFDAYDDEEKKNVKIETETSGSPMEVDDIMSKLDSHLANDQRVKAEASERGTKNECRPGVAVPARPRPPKRRKDTDPFIHRPGSKKPRPN